jgi:hypothetical protein
MFLKRSHLGWAIAASESIPTVSCHGTQRPSESHVHLCHEKNSGLGTDGYLAWAVPRVYLCWWIAMGIVNLPNSPGSYEVSLRQMGC